METNFEKLQLRWLETIEHSNGRREELLKIQSQMFQLSHVSDSTDTSRIAAADAEYQLAEAQVGEAWDALWTAYNGRA